MKNAFGIVLILMLASAFSFASKYQKINLFPKSDKNIEVTQKTRDGFTLKISIPEIKTAEIQTTAGFFNDIFAENFTKDYSHPGKPHLPVFSKLFEIPANADFSVIVTGYDEQIIDLSEEGILNKLIPAQPSISKGTNASDVQFLIDQEAYLVDDFNEDLSASASTAGIMRGIQMGKIRVSPFRYNPVRNLLMVYNNIEIQVVFNNADHAKTQAIKTKNYSPFFESSFQQLLNYEPAQNKDAITAYPITYVIVSDRMFETTLVPFVEWKTKKGFKVIEAYTDVIGTTTTAIHDYLANLYATETPAPTFVLFVGDVAQIPAYTGTTGSHVSDLYYCTYDGGSDYIPELFYGRFSVESTTELQNVLEKQFMHELYTWPSDNFLDECVMVAGVDGSFAPTHGNGQIYYGIDQYFNQANGYTDIYAYLYGTSTHPYQIMSSSSAGASADIISKISNGVGFANYTAHCSEDGWADPGFSRSDIAGLANADEYPVMIGNCCLSAKFNTSDAFGEMIVYAQKKGAVAYMGASNNSLWDEDFYWSVGVNTLSISSANAQNHTYANTGRGAYDGVWHTNGEPEADWYITSRAMLHCGNMAVESSSSNQNIYYWEIYHLMGDPSLMPYLSKPSPLTVSYNNPIPIGVTSLIVNTEQYAYVAISQNGVLLDAVYSGTNTSVTLNFPPFTSPGIADVVVTKQNRQPYIGTVEIINNTNANDAMVSAISIPNGVIHISNATVLPTVEIKNLGIDNLTSVKVRYFIDSGSDVNFDWTGDIVTFGTATVEFPQVTLPEGVHTFTAFTYLPNGNPDEYTPNDTMDITFTVYSGNIEMTSVVVPGDSYCSLFDIAPTVTITNLDAFPLTSATIGYSVDGGPTTAQNWSGNLAAGASADVVFPFTALTSGTHTIEFTATNINGGTDSDPSDNTISLNYSAASGQIVQLDLTTDNYGSETTWNLVDDNSGVTLYSGGPYSDGSEQNFLLEWCLPVGCYTFTIDDSYGDGICTGQYGNGSYSISNLETTEVYGTGCDYGSQDILAFCVVALDSPPTAGFSSDITASCTGEIVFTNESTGLPTSLLWDFGDGNTSTEQNPIHVYSNSGVYTVSLTATNDYGSNTATAIDLITIDIPEAPSATGDAVCESGSMTLTATGSGQINWYTDALGGSPVGTGNSFNTPVLSSTTTYYAEDILLAPMYNVGETNNTTNGAMYNSDIRYLQFDVYETITLLSVEVNASGAANRTIQLCDNSGTVLQQVTVSVPANVSRIDLNFEIPPGTNYRLKGSGTLNLYRSNAGLAYPYEIPGIISIKQSDAGTGYYYFFYDWQIKVGEDCVSPRTPVVATVNNGPSLVMSATNESTGGANNGTATATPTGVSPFTYYWNNGQTSETATGLASGTYYVTVTDINGCSASGDVFVDIGSIPFSAAISYSSNITCFGACDGTAIVTGTGGTAPYTYIWSDSQTSQTASALCAMLYSVTMTDAMGTTATAAVTLSEPLELSAQVSSFSDNLCFGSCFGSATAEANGGTPGYSFQWNDDLMQNTQVAVELCNGTYTVVVSDANGCTASAIANIVSPDSIVVTTSSTPAGCSTPNGTATVLAEGGVSPYSFIWDADGTPTTQAISGLASGTYSVSVADANGCPPMVASVIVEQATAGTISFTGLVNNSCSGDCSGSATIEISGGTAPFTYLWSGGAGNSETASNLCSGNYSVAVMDANGCYTTDFISISEPYLLTVDMAITPASSNTASDGIIEATANGGTSPYNYFWSNLIAGPYNDNLLTGTYCVTVTDANLCTVVACDSVGFTVGITSITDQSVEIYPNPSDGLFTLEMDDIQYPDFRIVDMLGKKITEGKIHESTFNIDLSKYPAGIYYIVLSGNKATVTRKITIK